MSPATGPVALAKRLRFLAMNMVVAGLIVGVGLPVLFLLLRIEVVPTSLGIDAVWLVAFAIMIFDFALARVFWRRANAVERGAMPDKAA